MSQQTKAKAPQIEKREEAKPNGPETMASRKKRIAALFYTLTPWGRRKPAAG